MWSFELQRGHGCFSAACGFSGGKLEEYGPQGKQKPPPFPCVFQSPLALPFLPFIPILVALPPFCWYDGMYGIGIGIIIMLFHDIPDKSREWVESDGVPWCASNLRFSLSTIFSSTANPNLSATSIPRATCLLDLRFLCRADSGQRGMAADYG